MGVFVIAEAGCTWECNPDMGRHIIEAAKACGADAVKFQWTSNGAKMADRRGLIKDFKAADMYGKYLQYPPEILQGLKAHADKVGIEFMCTVYLIEDIPVIAPLVKRFKVSAYERAWMEFIEAHTDYDDKELIISENAPPKGDTDFGVGEHYLYCVSKYPTRIEDLNLWKMCDRDAASGEDYSGLSDHTANVLTGAAAVAAGASIVEAHIRLCITEPSNPDYGHSLVAGCGDLHKPGQEDGQFREYVSNIRTVERML